MSSIRTRTRDVKGFVRRDCCMLEMVEASSSSACLRSEYLLNLNIRKHRTKRTARRTRKGLCSKA
eukprot:1609889-Amphidinium_carterae.1